MRRGLCADPRLDAGGCLGMGRSNVTACAAGDSLRDTEAWFWDRGAVAVAVRAACAEGWYGVEAVAPGGWARVVSRRQ